MDSPWNELLSGLIGLVLAFLAQRFGLQLPPWKGKEDPAGRTDDAPLPSFPLDPAIPREPVSLRRKAEEAAEKAGLDPRKIKVLDLTTLTLILTLLTRYGPLVVEFIRGLVDAIWARKQPSPEPPAGPSPDQATPAVANTDS